MSANGVEEDNFKPVFKYYKNNEYLKKNEENKQIIDFSNIDSQTQGIREIAINSDKCVETPIAHQFRDRNEWQMFATDLIDGLLVVPQILKRESSKKWFNYLLEELPFDESQHLKANISLPPTKPIEDSNLRWISFGYHHNWDTKMYDESNGGSAVPLPIQQLFQYMSLSLGFEGFRGEAGLINYYTNNSTLCPHSDHSEPNTSAPLFSLSLGSSAIFLIGGTTKGSTKPIVPIYLRDGDLLIMSSECRQAFHAIPKVLNDSIDNKEKRIKRININMRQMY